MVRDAHREAIVSAFVAGGRGDCVPFVKALLEAGHQVIALTCSSDANSSAPIALGAAPRWRWRNGNCDRLVLYDTHMRCAAFLALAAMLARSQSLPEGIRFQQGAAWNTVLIGDTTAVYGATSAKVTRYSSPTRDATRSQLEVYR